MKTTSLILISLASFVFQRPPGFCTGNIAREPGAAKNGGGAKDAGGAAKEGGVGVAPGAVATVDASAAPGAGVIPAEIQRLLAEQADQIAEMKRLLGAREAEKEPEVSGTLALLCKGAGIGVDDVLWRVNAGLDQDQAVKAAEAQRDANARKAKSGKR